jgi:hypothetical protein
MNNENQQFEMPPQPPPRVPTPPSHLPSRAALFAIIPGIGAVYNREYVKAVVHLSVFAGLVIIAESVAIFSLLAFSFYVYTIIDSYRSAELISRRVPGEKEKEEEEEINLPFWGGTILLMGILFLLDNLRSAFQFWPLLLVALGGYLIWKYLQNGKRGAVQETTTPIQNPTYTPPPTAAPPKEPQTPQSAEIVEAPETNEGEKQ